MSAATETRRQWSKAETHCVVCLRPFPTEADIERHAEQECGDPCWCWDICWVNQGGACDYPPDLDDDLAVFGALRAAEEDAEQSKAILQALLPFAGLAKVAKDYRPAWRSILEAAEAAVVIPNSPEPSDEWRIANSPVPEVTRAYLAARPQVPGMRPSEP